MGKLRRKKKHNFFLPLRNDRKIKGRRVKKLEVIIHFFSQGFGFISNRYIHIYIITYWRYRKAREVTISLFFKAVEQLTLGSSLNEAEM